MPLSPPAERELHASLSGTGQNVSVLCEKRDYRAALEVLASLRDAVDRFFDDVMVMDEDPARRTARLGLLATFNALAHEIVDLSELVVEGK